MKKPFNYQLFYRRAALIAYDIVSVIASSFLAILIRYDFQLNTVPEEFMLPIRQFMLLDIVLALGIFYLFRLYHSLWAFAGETELQNLVMACLTASVADGIGINFFRMGTKAVPDSYYFLYFFFLLSFLFASRFSYRFFRSRKHKLQNRKNSVSVMIIGAGEAGNAIIKEIVTSNYSTMVIRCIIDDDKNKWGSFIQGIKVVGGRDKIIESADLYDIDEILLAIPSASPTQIRELLEICKETNCKLRSLPGLYQLANGDVNVSKLRDVEVEDLLGREPIRVDIDSILGYVQNKVVLVTGGGGSIGSELCRQIAGHRPAQLIVFDIYENNAYDLQQELKEKFPELNLTVLIGSVRNTNRINAVFETYHPDIVYHAAAHKHVPLMEDSPNEAVKNNVFGTWKTAMAAAENHAEKFVMISTDKAVNPVNLYGGTKLVSDKLFVAANAYVGNKDVNFSIVRYGNVAGSRGSIIPLFRDIIARGETELPITDVRMTRFWISLEEGIQLVIKALEEAKGGETFISKIPSFKITDLAEAMLPGCRIKEIGIRPGEKLHEIMVTTEDSFTTYEYDKHFIVYPQMTWNNKQQPDMSGSKVKEGFSYSSDNNTEWLSVEQIRELLKTTGTV